MNKGRRKGQVLQMVIFLVDGAAIDWEKYKKFEGLYEEETELFKEETEHLKV